MKGGASAAGGFAEIVENTYGWNVMKPKAIDKELWDDIYRVYVQDKYKLGTKTFFEQKIQQLCNRLQPLCLKLYVKECGKQHLSRWLILPNCM